MSNYIQVLKRLQKEKGADRPSAPAPSERSVAANPAAPAREPAAAPPSVEPVAAPTAIEPVSAVPTPPPSTPRPSAAPERVRSATKRPTVAPAPVATIEPKERALPAAPPARVAPPAPVKRHEAAVVPAGIAVLFDRIRTLEGARTPRTIVFAAAANADSVGGMTAALALHAERHGLHVTLADLIQSSEGTVLMRRPSRSGASVAPAPAEHVLDLDLSGAAADPPLAAWIQRVAPDTDLVIVTGPPLADSIDAALFARACDGLVIVADTEVTARGALQTAAERARIAGCHTLGVVMRGTEDRTPAWMRRMFATDRRPPTA
jgi:hypothetical protein